MSEASAPKRVTRRTVAKGAAWTVPAVIVAAPAASAAASPDEPTIEHVPGTACKLPGASCQSQVGVTKGYAIAVEVCHNFPGNVTFEFTSVTDGLLCGISTTWDIEPDPLVAGTGCATVIIGLDGEPNSANCPISGTVHFDWETEDGLFFGSGSFDFSADATPPCDNCSPL